MRGHHGSALSHINSGVKILSEVEFTDDGEQRHGALTTSPHPFVDFQELEILFNRLDAQAAQACQRFLLLTPSPYEQRPSFFLSCYMFFPPLSTKSRSSSLTALQMIGTRPMLLKKHPRDIRKGFG